MLVVAELFARFGLGLGNPPLYVPDPKIEYLMRPSMIYNRFGNRVVINQWSMRSEDFPRKKARPDEYRVMVFGDSVLNGGGLIDQNDLATEVLKANLKRKLGRPVVVGNISAGSWGPPNMLAYAEKFGLFDADVVILVLSSQDSTDVPSFEPLGPDAPTRAPAFALQEALTRYLPRYLPEFIRENRPTVIPHTPSERSAEALAAMSALIQLAKKSDAIVAVAQHLEREESTDNVKPGHEAIAAAARAVGSSLIQIGPAFKEARDRGEEPYSDELHPNKAGHALIGIVLSQWVIGTSTGWLH